MAFMKGQSGNLNGRPKKGRTLTEALETALKRKRADGKSTKAALAETLIDLAISDKNIYALKYIFDRIDGRPVESILLGNDVVETKLKELMNGR